MSRRWLWLLPLAAALAQAGEPAGLREGPVVDVRGTPVQVHLWALPGDAGDLELVEVEPGLFIGRHEVTRRAYAAFCLATGREMPPGEADDHPVADVTWEEARAFCAWAGLALPREAEWERAARGPDPRRFPWGDQAGEGLGNFCDADCPEDFEWKEADVRDGFAYTAPVGSFPAGAAPCGALDMAGNVWEWCEGAAGRGARAARGGGWCSPRVTGQVTFRHAFPPGTRWAGLGFRPVKRP